MKSNRIDVEEKLKRYIRFKKAFTFKDALIITGASKEQLTTSLNSLVISGDVVIDTPSKSIMAQVYKVAVKQTMTDDKPYDAQIIKTTQALCKMLIKHESDSIEFIKLFNTANIAKDIFIKVMDGFCATKLLTVITPHKEYGLNHEKVEVLLTFLKQKKYEEVQLIIELKKPLVCVELPPNLPAILEVIMENEVLKRDELSKLAKITRKKLTDWWQVLKKVGVVTHSFKEEPNGRLTYVFCAKRAKQIMNALNHGAWQKDEELRHLWLKR